MGYGCRLHDRVDSFSRCHGVSICRSGPALTMTRKTKFGSQLESPDNSGTFEKARGCPYRLSGAICSILVRKCAVSDAHCCRAVQGMTCIRDLG
eukprot:scaffold594086_cov20-Prasinocladus_malaysianus.AAC.1